MWSKGDFILDFVAGRIMPVQSDRHGTRNLCVDRTLKYCNERRDECYCPPGPPTLGPPLNPGMLLGFVGFTGALLSNSFGYSIGRE